MSKVKALVSVWGLSRADIAAILGVSESTAKGLVAGPQARTPRKHLEAISVAHAVFRAAANGRIASADAAQPRSRSGIEAIRDRIAAAAAVIEAYE